MLSDQSFLNPVERTTYRDFPNAVVRIDNQLPQLPLQDKLLFLPLDAEVEMCVDSHQILVDINR